MKFGNEKNSWFHSLDLYCFCFISIKILLLRILYIYYSILFFYVFGININFNNDRKCSWGKILNCSIVRNSLTDRHTTGRQADRRVKLKLNCSSPPVCLCLLRFDGNFNTNVSKTICCDRLSPNVNSRAFNPGRDLNSGTHTHTRANILV